MIAENNNLIAKGETMKGCLKLALFTSKILIIFFCMNITAQNQLCKIFHHDLSYGKKGYTKSKPIELGKIVFYFTKNPEVRVLPERNVKDKKELSFLFPATEIKNKKCMAMLEKLNSYKNQFYSVKIEQVKKPFLGLNLSVVFDPQQIEITYDTFDSINLYKGLVFTFYDKKLLEQMNLETAPLIRMVSCESKPRVVIDCGHGGSDVGAVGCGGTKEKDLTLTVGLQLENMLKRKGINSILTRKSDVFVPLDQRTRYAANYGDNTIFVSLHANFAENKTVSGIETFCLSPPLLKCNFKTMHSYIVGLLEYIICDKYKKSQLLAKCLHKNTLSVAGQINTGIVDRSIKHAVSQVLLGSASPSVLVELGFISNKYESNLLQHYHYQNALAKGICDGILSYFTNIKG